jgi:putative colanic acid biosynthesis acetyltransferase WcaF
MKPSTDLSKYSNDWYKAEIGASGFKQIAWYWVNVCFFINPLNPFSSLKRLLLRWFGGKIGKGVVIKPSVNIKYPWKLTIGDYSWIGEKVWIDNLARVEIGRNVCISQGAMLLTGNHDYTKSTFDLMIEGIVLEYGGWIVAKSLVCPGVYGESHAVLAAMSVATRRLNTYTIYQGNPALPVRERSIVA